MQIKLFLCISTLYYVICLTAAYEDDTDLKSNEDNFAFPIKSSEIRHKIKKENKEYEAEKKNGNIADLFGTNQHYSYPENYKDLGRRFVPQYPYAEISNTNEDEDETKFDNIVKDYLDKNLAETHLIPVKAPPELVLAVGAKAALLEAAIPRNPLKEKIVDKEILRSGNYWNDVWREDVSPGILRTQKDKVIQPIRAKVMAKSRLYNLVSELKKISPKLIYVINKT